MYCAFWAEVSKPGMWNCERRGQRDGPALSLAWREGESMRSFAASAAGGISRGIHAATVDYCYPTLIRRDRRLFLAYPAFAVNPSASFTVSPTLVTDGTSGIEMPKSLYFTEVEAVPVICFSLTTVTFASKVTVFVT